MEVAADWHELMIPWRGMQPSTACDSGQVDPGLLSLCLNVRLVMFSCLLVI